jgi:hypothetical protein
MLGVALLGDLLGSYAILGGLLVIGAAVFVAATGDRSPATIKWD